MGATPVKLDLLDVRAVSNVVLENEPEAIVHQATALGASKAGRSIDKVLARTSELRTKGTDALLTAAREAGVRRFVAQSFAPMRYAREGGPFKSEDDALDPTPPKDFQQTAAALIYLEQAVTDFGGIALRYGAFYGASNDGLIEPVRKRRLPIVGDGAGVSSWIHLEDAATAAVLALEHEGRRSTTSSTTNPRRYANGCRCSPRRWARSLRDASRPGSRGRSRARPRS